MIRSFDNIQPEIAESAYIDEQSAVIGDVSIAEDCSVWPMASIRGDMHHIRIGARTNIQDGSSLHVTHKSNYNPDGFPLIIGEEVTVGHNVVLHGCTIGNNVLIGMGSVILDGAVVEDEVLIGAGSLVSPNSVLQSGYLYLGSPAIKKRQLKESEKSFLHYSPQNYVSLKNQYLQNK